MPKSRRHSCTKQLSLRSVAEVDAAAKVDTEAEVSLAEAETIAGTANANDVARYLRKRLPTSEKRWDLSDAAPNSARNIDHA
jgi:hypothetical protein